MLRLSQINLLNEEQDMFMPLPLRDVLKTQFIQDLTDKWNEQKAEGRLTFRASDPKTIGLIAMERCDYNTQLAEEYADELLHSYFKERKKK